MKIAKYIGDLIYDYECVVIPGLGGFISTQKSAQINKLTHQFKPPVKDIHFNIHLKANDGLLINYVARNEGLSYKEAKQKVDKFVLLCNNALNNGKKINFNRIGYIYRDSKENIVFNQDNSVNYNSESFGLSAFVSPAVRRVSDEQKIKEVFSKTKNKQQTKHTDSKKVDRKIPSEGVISDKMIARSKPSKVKQQLLFIFAILFVFSSYYIYNKRDAALYYWNSKKHLVPFVYSQPHNYLSVNAGLLHLENVNSAGWFIGLFSSEKEDDLLIEARKNVEKSILEAENDKLSPTDDKLVENKDETSDLLNDKPEDIIENEINTDEPVSYISPKEDNPSPKENISKEVIVENNKFFIIAGSFGKLSNAERLVNKLRNSGFDAVIADTNNRGLFRVAYMGFSNTADAERKLLAIRNETNAQAWLLKK
ncbi:MAG: hypothetical protein C0598_12920 [Marinilabiliales bacterium]|nr:MAG: hypothetical protein C0598_12920 [Marinilabiliales bacterium]